MIASTSHQPITLVHIVKQLCSLHKESLSILNNIAIDKIKKLSINMNHLWMDLQIPIRIRSGFFSRLCHCKRDCIRQIIQYLYFLGIQAPNHYNNGKLDSTFEDQITFVNQQLIYLSMDKTEASNYLMNAKSISEMNSRARSYLPQAPLLALTDLSIIFSLNYESLFAINTCARVFLILDFFDNAIQDASYVIDNHIEKEEEIFARATRFFAYCSKMDFQRADIDIQNICNLDPKNELAIKCHSLMQLRMADNRLYSIPCDIEALINKSSALLDLGEPDKAIECASICLEMQPLNVHAHIQLGLGYLKKNDASTALKWLKKGLSLISDLYSTRLSSAIIYDQEKEYQKVIDLLEPLSIFVPSDPIISSLLNKAKKQLNPMSIFSLTH